MILTENIFHIISADSQQDAPVITFTNGNPSNNDAKAKTFVISGTDSKGNVKDIYIATDPNNYNRDDYFSSTTHSTSEKTHQMLLYKQTTVFATETTGLYDAIIKARAQLYIDPSDTLKNALTMAVADYKKISNKTGYDSLAGNDAAMLNNLITVTDAQIKTQVDTLNKKAKMFFDSAKDPSYNTFKSTVTSKIVNDYYYRSRFFELPEENAVIYKRAKNIVDNGSSKDSERLFTPDRLGDRRAYGKNTLGLDYYGTNKQITGIWASPGDKLYVFVTANANETKLPKLMYTQKYEYKTITSVQLKAGLNIIDVKSKKNLIRSPGIETGSPVYIINPYTKEEQGPVSVYIDGGDKFPVYDISEDPDAFRTEITEYAEHLKNNEEGYRNIFEMRSRYSIMTFGILNNIETLSSSTFSLKPTLEKWDEMAEDFFAFDGITDPEVYKDLRLHVRGYITSAGASAFIEVLNVRPEDEIKVIKINNGWGVPHEFGHDLDNPARKYVEVTNNMWAIKYVLEKYDTDKNQYSNIAVKKSSPKYFDINTIADDDTQYTWLESYNNNGLFYGQLYMFWDLEVWHNGFWAKFDTMFRNKSCGNAEVDAVLRTTGNKKIKMAVYASIATQTDLTAYFERYGFISGSDKTYAKAMNLLDYPALDKKIWYYSETSASDLRTAEKTENISASGKISMNMDSDNTLYLNLSNEYYDAHLGYEILINGKFNSYTWDSKISLSGLKDTDKITVNAYDLELNCYYSKTATVKELKTAKAFTFSVQTSRSADAKYVNLGEPIKFVCSADGGTGNYQYSFSLKKGSAYTLLRNYDSDPEFSWVPEAYGDYYITVYAKDTTSNSTYKTMYYIINTLNVPSRISNSTITLDEPVKYKDLTIKNVYPENSVAWVKAEPVVTNGMVDSIKLTTYTNTTGARRNAYLVVYANGYRFTVKISQGRYILDNKSTLETSSVTLGSYIKFTPKATAEYTPLKFKVAYKKTGGDLIEVCNYTTQPAQKFKPAEYGSYTLYIYAKDGYNKIATKSFIFTVELKKGDVNADGVVNIRDVTEMQRALAEITVLDEFQKRAADVNNDGTFSINDVSALQKQLAEY